MDKPEYIGGCQALRVEADETGLSGQVDNGSGNSGVFQQFSFKGVDTGSTVQTPDTKGDIDG
jgi:hypothetical protein